MNTAPIASIIIVTWNAKPYVQECLASICADKELDAEIIVVDNASTDGTPEMVATEFPQAQLIRNAGNYGFAKGNNIGIAASHGKYICLVNSDVNVPAGCIEKLISYLEQNGRVGVVGPQMLGCHGEVRRSTMQFPTLWNLFCRAIAIDVVLRNRWTGGLLMSHFQHDHVVDVEVLNGWFLVVRRSALQEVGLLDEAFFMYGEDLDWCYRFHKDGWRLVFNPAASAVHYGGASSAVAPVRFYMEMQRANLKYWRKHHGSGSQWMYKAIVIIHELIRLVGHGAAYVVRRAGKSEIVVKLERSAACLRWAVTPTARHFRLFEMSRSRQS